MGCMLTNFTQTLQDFLSRWTDFTPLPAHDITQSEDSLHSPVRVHHNVMHGHPSIQLTHCGTRTERAKHEQIFRAVRSRDKQMLRSLILDDTGDGEGGQSLVCAADRNGVNPVELACLLGYTDEVMLFIEHGCSPNLPTSIGRLIHTVLECMKSQSIGVPEGSQLLNVMCEQGCDVRMKDRKRKTTLLYATELGDINVLELVIKYGGAAEAAVKDTYSGYTPLHMAAMKGDLTCLRVLLREGPASQINMLDNNQRSALLLALKMMIHDLRYLHNDPTEISGPNREKLILHQYNSIAVVEALLVAGADANQGDPLSCALELVQLDEENRIMLANCDGSPYLSSLNRRCQIVFSPGAEGGPASPRSVPSSNTECVSPYTGVVRLLIYSGAQPQQADQWRVQFKSFPYVLGLVDEITDFWKCYQMVKPPKLLHLCKQCIRTHLAKILKLHQIDSLSLPSSMIDYLKLRCL